MYAFFFCLPTVCAGARFHLYSYIRTECSKKKDKKGLIVLPQHAVVRANSIILGPDFQPFLRPLTPGKCVINVCSPQKSSITFEDKTVKFLNLEQHALLRVNKSNSTNTLSSWHKFNYNCTLGWETCSREGKDSPGIMYCITYIFNGAFKSSHLCIYYRKGMRSSRRGIASKIINFSYRVVFGVWKILERLLNIIYWTACILDKTYHRISQGTVVRWLMNLERT